MAKNELAFMESHIQKTNRIFKFVLSFLILLELALTVRGILFFNLARRKLRWYLYSYLFLLTASVVAMWILLRCKEIKKLTATIYAYAFCLIMWSSVVTCVDSYANGDSGIIVYVMTCVSVGLITLIKPQIFLSYLGISGGFFLVFSAYLRGWQPFSSGFYINFAVFAVVAIFVNAHNYNLSKRAYETSQKLQRQSYIDQLTNIFNRRRLKEQLTDYLAQQRPFLCVLLDVDNLKCINDAYGHPKGDECLCALAQKLTARFGEQVYRFGGDEFAVLAEGEIAVVFDKLDELNRELKALQGQVDLHISAGVYEAKGTETTGEVFTRVDTALYEAKNSGKGKWCLYKADDEGSPLQTLPEKELAEENGGAMDALKGISSLLSVYDKHTKRFTYHEDFLDYFNSEPTNLPLWDFLEQKGITSAEDAKKIQEIVLSLNEKNSVFFSVYSFGVMGRHILSFTYVKDTVVILVKLFDQGDLDAETIKYDDLTRLPTRTFFCREVEKLRQENEERDYALFFFDIVKFKSINDIFGYKKGDEILEYVASVLQSGLLPIRCASRVFADKFAFLADVTNGNAEEIANRLIAEIKKYDITFELIVNVGVYPLPKEAEQGNAMLDKAMLAQDAIKGDYNKCVCFYNEDIRNAIISEQEIFADMNVALTEEQFLVYYQPQYNHSTGMLVGAEALVRWKHPQKGMISPASFIPIFEKNGFITTLDFYVFDKVARFIRKSLDERYSVVPVSVNFSKHDIFSYDFVENLEKIRQKYDVPAKYLRVEITESVLIGNNQAVNDIIHKLRECGYVIEMDDFGSGYSSLNVLKDLDFDVIKLDMLFLQNEGKNRRGGTILSSVVNMAKWLHLPIIAEGVETVEQADFLRSIGCNYIQGYLYSKPLPEEEYVKLVSNSHIGAIIPQMDIHEKLHTENFWEPTSQETLIFSNLVGAACIFNYHRKTGAMEILRVNKKYLRELGMNLSEEELIHNDPWTTLDEENKAIYLATMKRAVETKEEQECETWRVLRSACCGTESFFVRSTMTVIGESENQVLFYCTIRNITAEKTQATSMQETEKRFKMASEQANMYFWEYTIATKEMRPCFRCMRDLGLPPLLRNYPDSAIERGIFPPEVADMYRDWHVQIANGVKALEAIIPLTPDRVPFRVKYTTEFDVNGHPVKAYGSAVLVVE